jgi:hypothetical protein
MEAARNTLESAIYLTREKTEDEGVVKVSTEEELEKLRSLASETEDWLMEYGYDDATTLAMLGEKEADLNNGLNRLRGRALELEHREQAVERIAQVLQYVNETVEFVKLNRTWVKDQAPTAIEGVLNRTRDFEAWWANVSAQQEARAITEDPAYSVNDVAKRLGAVQKEAERLMRIQYIPKPVPAPTPSSPKNWKTATSWTAAPPSWRTQRRRPRGAARTWEARAAASSLRI